MNNIQGEVIDKYWRWKKTHTTCWELQNFLCDLIGNDLVEEIEGGIVAESHSRTEVLREFVAFCHKGIHFPEEVHFAQQVKEKVKEYLSSNEKEGLETQAFTTGAVTQQYVKWDDLFTQLFDTGKQITSLIEQEKERAVMGFIDYMYGQNLPLHKAGVVTVRAFAKQYLAERKGE